MRNASSVSRRDLLKAILWTPPVLMFSKGGLFAQQEVRPLFAPRIVPPGQKIRVAQIGVFNRGADILRSFSQYKDQLEYKAFSDVLFLTPSYQMR
ncbi:MAG TPA: hypothetical protein PK525_13395, partial [Anaerohalosphaeraceae bacterium]|nr:hypothetical protein [Anaerohalosphaeraceae bacterium]